jgi:lipopolysaccharide assembly outer membrane protein LptD (OstA)
LRRVVGICCLLGLVAAGPAAQAAEAPPKEESPSGLREAGKGAKTSPVDITADTITYDRTRDLYTAIGHVRISQPGRHLTADWVSFSNKTRQGVASGNVVVVEGGDTLYASFLQFDVDSLQGVVYDGRLDAQASRFKMAGAEVRKTGESSYTFKEGSFTSCRCPEPSQRDPWLIKAKQADLEANGYGQVRNSTVEILGVPVIWLPYMIYPLKTERATGFLLPEINSSSRTGLEMGLPFFWAPLDELNVLLTESYLTRRGLKSNLDLEYLIGEDSHGAISAAYIHDKDIAPGSAETSFGRNRWFFAMLHDQALPDGWRAKADVTLVSDNNYPFDFRDLSRDRIDRFLESTAFAENHFGPSGQIGVVGAVRLADDLQAPDDSDRDKVLLQRLPELDLDLLPQPIFEQSRLLGTMGVQYAYFRPWEDPRKRYPTALLGGNGLFLDTGIDGIPDARERNAAGQRGTPDGSGDDFSALTNPTGTEGDGRFQEGEPLADRGHRLLFTPRLSYPTRLGDALEVLPEVGWYETLYDSNVTGFQQRGLFTARLDLRSRLRAQFDLPFGIGSVVHLLEPRLGWALVSSTSQGNDPLFVPGTAFPQQRVRQLDLDNVTLDPADRIERFDGLTVGLGNRFYGKGVGGDTVRLLGEANVSLLYDAARQRFGDLYVEGTAYPGSGFRSRLIFGYDADKTEVDEGLFGLGWTSPEGHDLFVGYRYLRNIPKFFENYPFDERLDKGKQPFDHVNQLSLAARIALTRSWALSYDSIYSLESSVFLRNRGGIEYLSKCKCWAVQALISDERTRGLSFNLQYRLLGLGDDTVRPFQSLERRGAREAGLVDYR